MRFLVTLLVLLSIQASYARDSLSWQKISLEEKIQRKYNSIISTVLKENQFLVDTEVTVIDPGQPNFDNNDKQGVKVSDLTMPESSGDYIAFSKMGLEVPILDKIFNENKDSLQNLYKFNEAYDLFKNLDTIKVTVYFSDKVPEKMQEIVQNLVRTTKFNVADIKPNFSFQTMEMEWAPEEPETKNTEEPVAPPVPEEKEPKIWTKDWYEWASRWGNAVGLVLFSIIMGVIAIMLFKQWKAFMENYAKMMAPQPKEEKDKDDDTKKKEEELLLNSQDQDIEEDELTTQQGYERFQQCLQQHPEEAVTIVHTWLIESSEETILALRGLAQMATPEEMNQLLNGLSEDQRSKWKSLLTVHLESNELKSVNKIIFREVVKSLLVPSKIKDGQLLNLVMELDPRSITEFFDAHPEQTGILLNLLGPSIISKVLSLADDKKVEVWLNQAATFDERSIVNETPALKEALMAFKKVHSPSPFLPRLMAMLQSATPATEESIFKAIASASGKHYLVDAANVLFPSELVLKLPDSFLKDILFTLPMNKRIEFLYSREPALKDKLIDLCAEAGTPARDLLDMEMQSLDSDITRQDSILNRKDEIWSEFVKLVRTSISKNASYKKMAGDIIDKWASQVTKGFKSIQGGKAA